MAIKTYREALTEALMIEMDRDERVIIMGEDVAGGAGGSAGVRDNQNGIFGTYPQFHARYGENRFIDTPISEAAIVGKHARHSEFFGHLAKYQQNKSDHFLF